jgi:hypothetical protein
MALYVLNPSSAVDLNANQHPNRRTKMKDNPAFSLFEVLITVAALIITTIVISNWFQSRRSAQESAAVAELRGINTQSFRNITLGQARLNSRFSGSISSYNFNVTASSPSNTANTFPASIGNGRF